MAGRVCSGANDPSIDLLNPDISLRVGTPTLSEGLPLIQTQTQTRWYLQDTINFGDRWVMAGLAGNRFFEDRDDSLSDDPVFSNKVTPRCGVQASG